jgi:hypothetical protein
MDAVCYLFRFNTKAEKKWKWIPLWNPENPGLSKKSYKVIIICTPQITLSRDLFLFCRKYNLLLKWGTEGNTD